MRKLALNSSSAKRFKMAERSRLWRCIELVSDFTIVVEMNKAVELENYERAIIFRDELERRKSIRETKVFYSGSQQIT